MIESMRMATVDRLSWAFLQRQYVSIMDAFGRVSASEILDVYLGLARVNRPPFPDFIVEASSSCILSSKPFVDGDVAISPSDALGNSPPMDDRLVQMPPCPAYELLIANHLV